MLDIKRLLFETNKTQAELGEIVGLPQSAISNMMKGFRQIRPEHIRRWKEVLGDQLVDSCIIPDDAFDAHAGAKAVQATILHRDLVDEIRGELTQPKKEDIEDIEVIEPLEAIPVISPELAKAPNTDIKELVMSGAKEVKRLSIVEFFEKFGDFDAVCPTYRDSMIPTYVPGDFLFIKYKPFTNDTYIKQGRYLLDTNDYGTILCIVEDTEDEYLTLTFKNTRKYKPMRIHKSNVLSIADIVLMVRMGDMAFETVDIGSLQVQLDKKDIQIDNLFAQLGSLTNQMDKQGDRTNRVIDQIEDALEQNKRLVNLMTENYLKKK